MQTTIRRLDVKWCIRHQPALETIGRFAGLDWIEIGIRLHFRGRPGRLRYLNRVSDKGG